MEECIDKEEESISCCIDFLLVIITCFIPILVPFLVVVGGGGGDVNETGVQCGVGSACRCIAVIRGNLADSLPVFDANT